MSEPCRAGGNDQGGRAAELRSGAQTLRPRLLL